MEARGDTDVQIVRYALRKGRKTNRTIQLLVSLRTAEGYVITLCGQILVSRTDDDPPPPRRVSIQNVPVYAGTTRKCVSTCARGAGTHGDVLNAHTGTF